MRWFLFLISCSLYSIGPSQSHLTSNHNIHLEKELNLEVWGKRKLINEVLKNEELYSHDYYIFYHASSNALFYQELLSYLFKSLKNVQVDDFIWLRVPSDTYFENTTDFFSQESGQVDDSKPLNRKNLLSVNLSLFGNSKNLDSCTLAFWLLNHLVYKKVDSEEVIREILDYFQLPDDSLEELINLAKTFSEASLIQIFIPKPQRNVLDQQLYFAHDGGALSEHQALFDPCQLLDLYVSDIKSVPNLDNLEARLLLNNKLLLNPDSGVLIKRYDANLSENQIDRLKKEIQQILEKQIKKIPLETKGIHIYN
ncbi:MAG: hypothetical protein S4CHLAM7_07770 [Chlamydiae bacterium]|nr:hypothetical protein [Chlamydiota bacterium]